MFFQKHTEAKVSTVYIWNQHKSKIHTIMEYLLPSRKHRIIPLKNNARHGISTFWEGMQFPEHFLTQGLHAESWTAKHFWILIINLKHHLNILPKECNILQILIFVGSPNRMRWYSQIKFQNKQVTPDVTVMHWGHPS